MGIIIMINHDNGSYVKKILKVTCSLARSGVTLFPPENELV